jgi:4-aminobutyrate aminotransferase
MLLLTTSVFDVVRFIPPLNVSEADMAKGCGIFEEALKEVIAEAK